MKSKLAQPFVVVVFVIASLAVLTLLSYWSFIRPSLRAPQSRANLIQLAKQIELGDSREIVRRTFERSSDSSITFGEHATDQWLFKTPLEFGAGNWILVVTFNGDSVDGVGVRTLDSLKVWPNDAPRDRTTMESRDRWQSRFGLDSER